MPVGEGLAPPADLRRMMASPRRGRRPRRPAVGFAPRYARARRGGYQPPAVSHPGYGDAPVGDGAPATRFFIRRGRRPRRPVCPTFYHVRGRPRAAAPTTETNDLSQSRRCRRPRRPAVRPAPKPTGSHPLAGAAVIRPPSVTHYPLRPAFSPNFQTRRCMARHFPDPGFIGRIA